MIPINQSCNKYYNKYIMYFTQTTIRNNRIATESEYVSTRLIRKGEITSYYVVKCLMHRTDPTVVGQICFLKQTIVS